MLRKYILFHFLFIIAITSVNAAERTIWQLGKPDHSEREFSSRQVTPEPAPVFVRIGKGAEENEWPRFHPGSGNGNAGGRPHPYTLVFQLPEEPRGVFYLKLNLLARQPRVPILEIDVNGKKGRVFCDPQFGFFLGEESDAFNPIHSYEGKTIALPASFFQTGDNQITIISIDDPPAINTNNVTGGVGDSGFYYDYLSLTNDTVAKYIRKQTASLDSSVFFRKQGNTLVEECSLTLRFSGRWNGGTAQVTIGAYSAVVDLSGRYDFGEIRGKLLIPESANAGKARIRVQEEGTNSKRRSNILTAAFTPKRRGPH